MPTNTVKTIEPIIIRLFAAGFSFFLFCLFTFGVNGFLFLALMCFLKYLVLFEDLWPDLLNPSIMLG